METQHLEAELRDVQAKIQAMRTGKFPLSDAKATKLEALMVLEDELYAELGPEWLESATGWAR